MGIVGFIIAMATLNTAARYISLFLAAGSYAGYIIQYTWMASVSSVSKTSNLKHNGPLTDNMFRKQSFPRPPAKRAVALALMNAISQLGNIAGSYVWANTAWAPSYLQSYAIVLACFVVAIGLNYAFRMVLVKKNKELEERDLKMDELGADLVGPRDEKYGFRYLY